MNFVIVTSIHAGITVTENGWLDPDLDIGSIYVRLYDDNSVTENFSLFLATNVYRIDVLNEVVV